VLNEDKVIEIFAIAEKKIARLQPSYRRVNVNRVASCRVPSWLSTSDPSLGCYSKNFSV